MKTVKAAAMVLLQVIGAVAGFAVLAAAGAWAAHGVILLLAAIP